MTPARVAHLVVDCNDLARVSAFWSNLLGLEVATTEDGWLDLEPLADGGPVLSFQRVPERKAVKNRLHLDLQVTDIGPEAERARALGASPASAVYAGQSGSWQIWRDPEGNEFCLVAADTRATA